MVAREFARASTPTNEGERARKTSFHEGIVSMDAHGYACVYTYIYAYVFISQNIQVSIKRWDMREDQILS